MGAAAGPGRARRETTARAEPVRVAIDLETTGLHPEQDAIIEIGALKFAGDRVLDTFESFVAPAAPIPYRIQRLTGISAAQLQGAPTMAELAPRLREFLADAPLVGHSVQFDAAFLRRHGIARRNPLVDTYELASMLLPSLASYTLGSVGAALGVASPTYHRALADAQLARDVFLALLARLDDLDPTTVAALDRLAAPPDWTPAFFLRRANRGSRDRGPSAGTLARPGGALGTLGAQLAAKLGVDPAVLSLAIAPGAGQAKPRQRAVAVAPLPLPAMDHALAQTATDAQDALRHTVAANIGQCLDTGGVLLAEVQHDDTGVLACLTEAIRWARERGERVLLSVAAADAASHLTQRLLPRAAAALAIAPEDAGLAELVRRDDYLCLHRWFGLARETRDGPLPGDVARGLAKLTVWAGQTYTGVRSEVALAGQELEAWDRARSGAEFADSTSDCAYRRDGYCFVARAQSAAGAARVVVTTHAALARHLAGVDPLLPEASRALVFDAHLLEDELRRVCTRTLDRQDLLAQLATLAQSEPGGHRAGLLHLAAERLGADGKQRGQAWFAQVERTRQAAEQLFAEVRRLQREATNTADGESVAVESPEQRTLRLDAAVREQRAWPGVVRAWSALDERLTAVARAAREAAQLVLAQRGARPSVASDGLATDLHASARLLEGVRTAGDAIFVRDDPTGADVTWLRVPYPPNQHNGRGDRRRSDARRHGTTSPHSQAQPSSRESTATATEAEQETPVLQRAQVRVGSLLAPLHAPGKGLIVTAPALAVAGDFTFARGSLGLPESAQTLEPRMDRGEQTLLCLPTDVPEPNAPQYQRRLDEALIALAAGLRGRLVVILPSHAALRSSAAGIRRALERHDILVLAQGQDGSARQLWQTFRTEPRVVLLGAGAFWEGAEQAEQPPACVVVTRVPFPALSDPLYAARAETWADPQAQFVVPHAALRLRQALGGLAWSHWRRNAVVLFDRRLQTRGYGPTILGTLPKCTQYQETMAQIAERVPDWVG